MEHTAMTPRILTHRQQLVLDFVRQACAKGRPPTLREIGDHMGIKSTNGVADHLRALERKGYLVRGDDGEGKARNIRPVDDEGADTGRSTKRALSYLTELQATPLTHQQRELVRKAAENLGAS